MKCSYCTSEVESGRGLEFVRKNGTVRYYCSTRCYKLNVKLGRKPNKKEIRESTRASSSHK